MARKWSRTHSIPGMYCIIYTLFKLIKAHISQYWILANIALHVVYPIHMCCVPLSSSFIIIIIIIALFQLYILVYANINHIDGCII